jgi:hypothetical protein
LRLCADFAAAFGQVGVGVRKKEFQMAKRLGRWSIGAAFLLIFLASQPTWAQTTASITGRV